VNNEREFGARTALTCPEPRRAARRDNDGGSLHWQLALLVLACAIGAFCAGSRAVARVSNERPHLHAPLAGSSFAGIPSGAPMGAAENTSPAIRLAANLRPGLVREGRFHPSLRLRASQSPITYHPSTSVEALPQFATGLGVRIYDGTNTMLVDPCKGQAKQYTSINQTANTQLVAGTASKKIYVCSIHVVVAAAANVALVEGTGSVCGTSTAGVSGFGGATAATGWNFAANGGIAFGNGDSSLGAEGTSGDNLCLFNSGSGQVSGGVSYVVQ
jgi:hypothetical protein